MAPPAAPSNLVAVTSGYSIVLTWVDNASDESLFEIERCEGGGCTSWALIAAPSANTTTYTDTSTSASDETYRYRIRAWKSGDGYSAYSNIADATTSPYYSVKFPGGAGNYYHGIETLSYDPFGSTPFGVGGCVAWVRIDAQGYATIYTSLMNFDRCFNESVIPSDLNEWDYQSIAQSWIWFGVKDGYLTFEAQDGRTLAKSFGTGGGTTSGTIRYADPVSRDAAITAFRAQWASLPHNDGVTVPIPTWFTTGFGIDNYFATFPAGYDGAHGGPGDAYKDLFQTGQVQAPTRLTPGEWYRVGYKWTSVLAGSGMYYTSSTIALFIDCVGVTSGAWDVALQGSKGFNQVTTLTSGGRLCDLFVGGDPITDLHREGATVTPIAITDIKIWCRTTPSDLVMANECNCDAGATPEIWWKLRSTSDLLDYGNLLGPPIPALPVGSIANTDVSPESPCEGVTPPPPPPEPPPDTGTLIVIKQTSPDTDTTPFTFTVLAPPPTPVVFQLSTGESRTFEDVPVGSGYSAIETPNPNYTTVYIVSNGSPHTSISIGANETVTVTVQNTYIPPPAVVTPPGILGLEVDCITALITATGQSFTPSMTITVTQNAQPITDFVILARTSDYVLIQLPGGAQGSNQFCVTVTDGVTPSTLCRTVDCPGCPEVLDDPTLQIIVTVANEPVITVDGENILGLAP